MLSVDEAADLIEAIASRQERAAFANLFRHFAPRVKAFIMRGGTDAEAAQEVAQEALIMVWRKAASFDRTRASAATWIYTIARNLRIDRIRRQPVWQVYDEDFSHVASEEELAEERIARAQEQAVIAAALDRLPSEQREVITLAFIDGLSHREIGETLGISINASEARLSRGIVTLRRRLETLL